MKQKTHIMNTLKSQIKHLNWRGLAFCMVVLFLSPSHLSAQFININIDIPAKSGVSELESSDMDWQSVMNNNQQQLEGTYTLTISSAENVQIMAILKHSDYLISASGAAIKLGTVLAYRNDGEKKSKIADSSDVAVFPMSNSGLLIDYMKDTPQLLKANLMVYTTIERPKLKNSIFTGDIVLTIEYN